MKLNFIVEDGDVFSLEVPEDEKVSKFVYFRKNYIY